MLLIFFSRGYEFATWRFVTQHTSLSQIGQEFSEFLDFPSAGTREYYRNFKPSDLQNDTKEKTHCFQDRYGL